jgi:hypothetical protein
MSISNTEVIIQVAKEYLESLLNQYDSWDNFCCAILNTAWVEIRGIKNIVPDLIESYFYDSE